MLDDKTDCELMALLAGGQDAALNQLVLRWRTRLAAFLLQMTGNHSVALDLTQETFVRIYHGRNKYQPKAAFSSWVFKIATNLARDHARWRARRPVGTMDESPLANISDPSARPDQAAVHHEEIEAMNAAIAALPVELREALLLFVYENMGYAEIAASVGCTPKAVETRIYRARQLLKEALR